MIPLLITPPTDFWLELFLLRQRSIWCNKFCFFAAVYILKATGWQCWWQIRKKGFKPGKGKGGKLQPQHQIAVSFRWDMPYSRTQFLPPKYLSNVDKPLTGHIYILGVGREVHFSPKKVECKSSNSESGPKRRDDGIHMLQVGKTLCISNVAFKIWLSTPSPAPFPCGWGKSCIETYTTVCYHCIIWPNIKRSPMGQQSIVMGLP